jgi:uncharacterized protein (TIGR00251 family)
VDDPRTGRAAPPTAALGLDVRATAEGVTLRVRVKPRSSRDAIEGVREGALIVRLTAPPVEGAANAALARVIAKALRLPPSAVRLARGAKGRDKLVEIAGVSCAQLESLLGPPAEQRSSRSS